MDGPGFGVSLFRILAILETSKGMEKGNNFWMMVTFGGVEFSHCYLIPGPLMIWIRREFGCLSREALEVWTLAESSYFLHLVFADNARKPGRKRGAKTVFLGIRIILEGQKRRDPKEIG